MAGYFSPASSLNKQNQPAYDPMLTPDLSNPQSKFWVDYENSLAGMNIKGADSISNPVGSVGTTPTTALGSGGGAMTIPYQDFQNYFNSTSPGTTQDWAYGSLTMGDNGVATYTDPYGTAINFTSNTPLSELYQGSPSIASYWDDYYGSDVTNSLAPSTTLSQLLESQMGGGLGNAIPTSTSSSSANSSGLSGVNWNTDLAKALLPNLISTGQELPTLAGNLSDTLQGQYRDAMRTALGPDAFQGTLNQLASRGMLNSSVAGDALSGAASTLAKDIAQQGWNSQLAQQQAQMTVPSLLAGILDLAKETRTSSTSGSSSKNTNPLAPYELLAALLKS